MWIRLGLAVMLVMSMLSFAMMGVDKRRAVRGGRRIRERTLLLCALCFGAPGGFWGMRIFRHKTRHGVFRVGLPMMAVAQMGILAALWVRGM